MASSKREPLFTPDFLRVLASGHIFFLCFQSLVTTMPLYVAADHKWQVGMVVGTVSLASLLARPLAGFWVDRWGRRPFILLGTLLSALALGGYAISPNPYALLPLRILHGLALSLFTTANGALAFDLAPPQRRGEAVGFMTLASNSVILYGPLGAAILADRVGYVPYFLISSLLAMTMGPLALGLPKEQDRALLPGGPVRLRPVSAKALAPSLAFTGVSIGFGVVQAFLALLALERGLGNPGLFFLTVGLLMVLSRPLLGYAADRYGRGNVAVPGLVGLGVTMLLLAGTQDQGVFVALGALYGLSFSAAHVGLMTLAVERAGMAERGLAIATFGIAFDGGALLGSSALGPLADRAGLGSVYIAAGSTGFVGAAAAFLVSRTPAPRAAEEASPGRHA